jgi:hypothetical protein
MSNSPQGAGVSSWLQCILLTARPWACILITMHPTHCNSQSVHSPPTRGMHNIGPKSHLDRWWTFTSVYPKASFLHQFSLIRYLLWIHRRQTWGSKLCCILVTVLLPSWDSHLRFNEWTLTCSRQGLVRPQLAESIPLRLQPCIVNEQY